VFDRTQRGASPRRSRWRDFRDEHRILSIIIVVVGIIAILIGGHLYGRYLSSVDLAQREAQIEQLRAESQKQKRDIDSKSQQITQLQAKLTKTQAALDAILPSANTYNIIPNQTLILDQRVTVGLVGSPGNESVLLNINGKPQTVAVGQTVSVNPDAATKCQFVVQSFDVFKAVLVASCSAANAQ
jgi:type II secretory pathway pseudopilin PulG